MLLVATYSLVIRVEGYLLSWLVREFQRALMASKWDSFQDDKMSTKWVETSPNGRPIYNFSA